MVGAPNLKNRQKLILAPERFAIPMITTLAEAQRIIEDWRVDYNESRPHSSLKYQTPEEFAANRPFHKTQWAPAPTLLEAPAPPPIAQAAE